MRIKRFEFENLQQQWKLLPTTFDQLTLLVGASGVGKTQILRAIAALKLISQGNVLNGVSWSIEFDTSEGEALIWEGRFGYNHGFDHNTFVKRFENQAPVPQILEERIMHRGKQLIIRDSTGDYLGDQPFNIRLNREQSLVAQLDQEVTRSIRRSFSSIIPSSHDAELHNEDHGLHALLDLKKNYQDTPTIRAAPLGIRTKLFLAFENRLPVFFDIQQRFQEIFPHVEAIKVVPFFFDEQAKTFIETHLSIQLKEQGVANWISQSNISAGMLRALFHLADLYLISDGSVLLMDEFENSLGVNCIDELVSDMLVSSRQLQYILTSHHPYIINTIPFTNWKLVTRKAGVVKTHDPSRWDFGRSKHDAFMQLMQLEEFQTGREMSLPG